MADKEKKAPKDLRIDATPQELVKAVLRVPSSKPQPRKD